MILSQAIIVSDPVTDSDSLYAVTLLTGTSKTQV